MTRRSLLLVLLLSQSGALFAGDRIGFSPSSREEEDKAEKAFLETPTPDKARVWLAALTERPHVAGTPEEKREADYVRDRLKEFGLDVQTVRYEVFLNHPRSVSLKLVEPIEEPLSLREEPDLRDRSSGHWGMLPAFHGYGASGKAEAQVVYVNYGTKEDFDRLKTLGVSVDGRIVLVRYGANFRGLKVKEAQDRGALGVLIYSDPADDGYMKGDVYPDGPMRPPSAIQRGSVQFLSLGPGDPSTPGYASTPGAKHLTREKMDTIPKIPSLPLSYGEAEKILRRLAGPRVPDEWQGGLPFAYHLGPGLAVAAMDVQMDDGIGSIYDVIVRIPGTTEPDSLVLLGNHRDAWTPGAVDPNSGTAALLETARGFAAALKAGWKPRRTILLASWDAEEYGLVGSTEWAEEHAPELKAKAVAYLNLDVAVTGRDLRVSGVPSLRDLAREVAAAVPEPERGGSVGAAWERRERSDWAQHGPVDLGREESFELELSPLGSGSDYTAFLDHLGVPSLDFSFTGPYGVYHSVYDDFFWMSHFGDPAFVYHQAAARLYGLLGMRLASADVVPLRFSSYARALRTQLDALQRDATRKARGVADPATNDKPAIHPDFGPVTAALAELDRAGTELDAAVDQRVAGGGPPAGRLDDALVQVERAFLSPEGLPGRVWFQHLLVAPGLTTGYAPWPFPGLTQAVEDRDASLFDRESRRVVGVLHDGAERLRAATVVARQP
jgi:N-acetylated-alpha-linked acidic dipeptidase